MVDLNSIHPYQRRPPVVPFAQLSTQVDFTLANAKRLGCPDGCRAYLFCGFVLEHLGTLSYTVQHGDNPEHVIQGSTDLHAGVLHTEQALRPDETFLGAVVAWLQAIHAPRPWEVHDAPA